MRSGTTEEEDFARILAALDEVGAASVGDLVKLTGITKSTLDRRLKKLEGARHITSTGLAVKGAPVLWSRVA